MSSIGLRTLEIFQGQPEEEIEGPDGQRIRVVPVITPMKPTICPKCGASPLYQHGVRVQNYYDIRHFELPTCLAFHRRRWRCQSCSHTFSDPSADLHEDHRATNRLLRHIADQCTQHPFAVVARYIGLTDRTVAMMFMEHVSKLEKTYRFETPEWLGIDEVKVVGKYRCVLTNMQHLTMYDMLPSRVYEDLVPYFKKFPEPQKVKVFATDLWKTYAKVAETFFPKATVVADRFHIQRMGNNALENVRKSYRKSLTSYARIQLKDDHKLLLMNGCDLGDKEREQLDQIFARHPTLRSAWECKENFSQIYDADGRQGAETLMRHWLRSVPDDLKSYFKEPISVLNTRREHILNYFDHPVTNGYTESVNRLVKGMNSVGRGYSLEAIRAKMLYNRKALEKSAVRIDNGDRFSGFTMGLVTTASMMPSRAPAGRKLYYGPHIPTLADMLENGEFSDPKPLQGEDVEG